MKNLAKVIILFVEGDTDYEFFRGLLAYYRANNNKNLRRIKIYNVKGISRYESKVPFKFKNEIIKQFAGYKVIVYCSYDTDVFLFSQSPPINWSTVRNKLIEHGAEDVKFIKTEKMIEDWFLKDIKGICKFLKINIPKRVEGENGYKKMVNLFKRGNKIYEKGAYCHKFLKKIDYAIIRNTVKSQLKDFEEDLGFKK